MAGVVALLTRIVVQRQGNLAWDDADYLRRGLRIAGLASRQGHLDLVRALGQTLRDRPKPPWLVGWIEIGALAIGREHLTALIVFASALPFAILCLAVITIAARRYGATAGFLAVLGLIASPMALSYGAKVMVETFLALWILLVFDSASRFLERPTLRHAAILGTALGLASLTKLTVVLFFPLSAVVFLWRYIRQHQTDRAAWRPVVALAVPLVLIAGPWYLKNGVSAVKLAALAAQYQILGTALGLASLTKLTVALFFPLSAAVFLWRYIRQHQTDRAAWRPAVALAVPLALVAGPWYFKNGVSAVKLAALAAQYQILAEGKNTVVPVAERIAALGGQILGWPLLATLMLVAPPLVISLVSREKRLPRQAGDAFPLLVGVAAVSAALILMRTSYFDPRFLLPVWAALAVCLARLIQLASARFGHIGTGMAVALLAIGAYQSIDNLCHEHRTRTYWTAQALIDELVAEHHVKTIGNVGNCSDWNVCKTGLINELRLNPADCFVLHDLSKDPEAELRRRLGRLDAVIVLDRADLPPGFLEASPGLNRAYASIGGVLAEREDYRKIEPRVAASLPPLAVYVRRR